MLDRHLDNQHRDLKIKKQFMENKKTISPEHRIAIIDSKIAKTDKNISKHEKDELEMLERIRVT